MFLPLSLNVHSLSRRSRFADLAKDDGNEFGLTFTFIPSADCLVVEGTSQDEVRATHLDFRYHPIAEPEEFGNGGRVRWVEGRPGEAPAYAGTDFSLDPDSFQRRVIDAWK